MKRIRVAAVIGVLVFFGAACAEQDPSVPEPDELSIAIGDVPGSVEGNVVEIPVDVTGIEIVAADGDTSGETGHLHAFIDRDPVEVGEVIPREAGIVHSADNPVMLYGLSVGTHEITLVVGDGTHERFGEGVEDTVTVEVEGPSVDASAPATIEEGDTLEVTFESEGIDVVPADQDDSGDSGHYHVIVDADPPAAGEQIRSAEEGKVYHTAEGSLAIKDLAAGEHTLWVVMGDGTHTALDPLVMDKLTVTVG